MLPEHLPTQSQDTAVTTEFSGIIEAGIRLFNKRVFTVSAGKKNKTILSKIVLMYQVLQYCFAA